MIEHTFNLGDELKDEVTGFSGIVVGITKYATGCVHYGLQTRSLNNAIPVEWQWFDESRLLRVKENVVKFRVKENETSGNFPNAPTMN